MLNKSNEIKFVNVGIKDPFDHGTKEILRGNMLGRPSCRHLWRGVIVHPDFFVAKPAK